MGLQGNEEDVRFAWAAADRLAGSLRALASKVDAQAPARAAWVRDAGRDFRGRYAEAFERNAGTAARDGSEFAAALRDAAAKLEELERLARQEQRNREQARAWHARQEERNLAEEAWDWMTGGGEPPPPPARSGPRMGVQIPASGARGH